MKTPQILASLAGVLLIASPAIASAATPAKAAPAKTAAAPSKDACKNLHGAALKSCTDAQKKATKTK